MEVNVRYLGNVKFEVWARGHRLICDQPTENGGTDSGVTPPEFLLASLATCAGYYVAEYLKTRGLPSADLQVRVTAEKAKNPARLGSFRIELTAPALDGVCTRPAFCGRLSRVWFTTRCGTTPNANRHRIARTQAGRLKVCSIRINGANSVNKKK